MKSGKKNQANERTSDNENEKLQRRAVKTNLENLIKIAKLWQLIKFSQQEADAEKWGQVKSLKQPTRKWGVHSDKFKFLNISEGNVEKIYIRFRLQ